MSGSSRVARVRRCQAEGCFAAAMRGHIFCDRHIVSAEGISFNKEIQALATYLNAHEEAPTEDDLARREAMDRFQRRVKRGDFTKLLDASTSKVLAQAAADRTYGLELGALRFAIARTLSEEQDAHRMSLAIARLANAVSRLSLAEYGTRDPKPVVKYGEEWEPPLPGGEKLVHYIWRHRPADFEERYMAKIDDPDSLPWNIDRHVEADYRDSLQPGRANVDADGKSLPPPLPKWRRADRVESEGLRVEGNDGEVDGDGLALGNSNSDTCPTVDGAESIAGPDAPDIDLDDDRAWMEEAWAAQTEAAARMARGSSR
jgi:hypothetical protein